MLSLRERAIASPSETPDLRTLTPNRLWDNLLINPSIPHPSSEVQGFRQGVLIHSNDSVRHTHSYQSNIDPPDNIAPRGLSNDIVDQLRFEGAFARHLSATTQLSYSRNGIEIFREFLRKELSWTPDKSQQDFSEYLIESNGHPIPEHRAIRILAQYCQWLKLTFRVNGKPRSPTPFLQALQHAFRTGGYGTDFFQNELILRARQLVPPVSNRLMAKRKCLNVTNAITAEMLFQAAQSEFPEHLDLSFSNLPAWNRAGAFLTSYIIFNNMVRLSSCIKNNSRSKATQLSKHIESIADETEIPPHLCYDNELGHALRAEDVVLSIDGLTWIPSHEWKDRNNSTTAEWVGFHFLTEKQYQMGGRTLSHTEFRGSSEGAALLVRMIDVWSTKAEFPDGSCAFMSRPKMPGHNGPSNRMFIQKDSISKLAKKIASDHNLPTRGFSSKSFKIGGASTLKAAGASIDQIAETIGHRNPNSSLYYIRNNVDGSGGAASAINNPSIPTLSTQSTARTIALRDTLQSRSQTLKRCRVDTTPTTDQSELPSTKTFNRTLTNSTGSSSSSYVRCSHSADVGKPSTPSNGE